MGFDSRDYIDYALRENPKKTCRNPSLDGENTGLMGCGLKRKRVEDNCEQRGNNYDSISTVFGQMRKRSRVSNKSESAQLGFDIRWPAKKKRSKLRYKVSGFCNVPNFNSIIDFSENNEEEEGAAMGLMLLSSGFTNWIEFSCAFDSLENHSLISKAKILNRNKIKVRMQLNSDVSKIAKEGEPIGVESENKIDFESVEADPKINYWETSFGDHDCELGVILSSSYSEFGNFNWKNEFKKPVDDVFQIKISDSEIRNDKKFSTCKETSFDDHGTELGGSGFVGTEITDYVSKLPEKCEDKSDFKCNKNFSCFQALGENRAKKCNEKSDEMKISCEKKKSKCFHQCKICFKVFPSGQALGGHKRAHFTGFSEIINKEGMVVMSQQSAARVTDSNLGKQFDSGFGLKPWFAKSHPEPERIVISN